MLYLLFIIITLLIAIVYSIQTRIWQAETYHLEKEFPIGKNKKMDGVINERNKRTMELQIDTKRGEAQLITIDYYTSTSDEVYVRNYKNCK